MQSETVNRSVPQILNVERVLDRAIEALASMNVETLLQLVSLCHECETIRLQLPLTDITYPRLFQKLMLFDRLLRQTRINLNILGLEPEGHRIADGYRALGWH